MAALSSIAWFDCLIVAGVGVALILIRRAVRARRRHEFGRQTLELLRMSVVRGSPVVPILRRTLEIETRAFEEERLGRIVDLLNEGHPLGDALHRAAPRCFAPTTIAAIRAAESSDRIGVALTDAVREHDTGSQIAFRLRLAVGYPALVGALLLALGQAGLSHRMISATVEGGGEPSSSAPTIVGWVASLCVAVWVAVEVGIDSKRLRSWLSRVPLLGKGLRAAATARVMRSMSTLVTAGASLDSAIRDSAGAAGHEELESDLMAAADAAARGGLPTEVWTAAKLQPHIIRDLASSTSPENFAQRLRGVADRGLQRVSDSVARGQRNFQIGALAALGGGVAVEFARLLDFLQQVRVEVSEGMPW